MADLPKTEEELQALIATKLEEQKVAHDQELKQVAYNVRKEEEKKFDKFKADMKLSDDERAKQLAAEREKELNDELTSLREFKKESLLKERLVKENLPSYFANDKRLLTAEEGDLDKVIKVVKGEYEASLPKGNTHSTVVPTSTTKGPETKDDKGVGAMADVLKNL